MCVWLCWVFVAVSGLSLVAASEGYSLVVVRGLLIAMLLLLQTTGSRAQASVAGAEVRSLNHCTGPA